HRNETRSLSLMSARRVKSRTGVGGRAKPVLGRLAYWIGYESAQIDCGRRLNHGSIEGLRASSLAFASGIVVIRAPSPPLWNANSAHLMESSRPRLATKCAGR